MMWTNTPAEEAPVPDDYNVIKLYKILMMAVTMSMIQMMMVMVRMVMMVVLMMVMMMGSTNIST